MTGYAMFTLVFIPRLALVGLVAGLNAGAITGFCAVLIHKLFDLQMRRWHLYVVSNLALILGCLLFFFLLTGLYLNTSFFEFGIFGPLPPVGR